MSDFGWKILGQMVIFIGTIIVYMLSDSPWAFLLLLLM